MKLAYPIVFCAYVVLFAWLAVQQPTLPWMVVNVVFFSVSVVFATWSLLDYINSRQRLTKVD